MAGGLITFADASPLIGLARIGRLDLLCLLPTPIHVTREVWLEVTGGENRPGTEELRQAEAGGQLRVVETGDGAEYPQLDIGEASTLSAARRASESAEVAVILDERKARLLLRRNPELAAVARHHVSTVGLILLAKRRGAVPEVRPLLDDLRRQTFRMSQALYLESLEAAGEWPPS